MALSSRLKRGINGTGPFGSASRILMMYCGVIGGTFRTWLWHQPLVDRLRLTPFVPRVASWSKKPPSPPLMASGSSRAGGGKETQIASGWNNCGRNSSSMF